MGAPILFDRRSVRRQRDRAAAAIGTPNETEFLHREIGERLLERLGEIRHVFASALVLGCRDGTLARDLARRPGLARIVQADFSPRFAAVARRANRFFPTLALDEEALPFAPGSFDLVVAHLNLHWTNDLPGALIQIRRALRPDGLLLAALFGGATLAELRHVLTEAEAETAGGAGPRVSPFAEVRDMGGLLQRAGFALPMADRDRLAATYEHAFSLMHDLRRMGEANALAERRKGFTRRRTLLRAAELYRERYSDRGGRLVANFEVIYLTAWSPAASQPKPLKPGSAAQCLADALNTKEIGTGEKAG